MAGRGCAITVYVNPGRGVNVTTVFGERTVLSHVEEHENGMVGWVLPLFVALHTPLEVLRGQLQEQTGFAPHDQVLILCDLSDKDRNHDQVLEEDKNQYSLYDCNIREGSILSLHPLGLSLNNNDVEGQEKDGGESSTAFVNETHTISTPITAAQADHSYNGIIFDIETKGPFEIDILSLSVGGMLGRVRIYAREGSYEQVETEPQPSTRWWAHHSSISQEGWELVVDKVVKASWDSPSEIQFDKKVTILPRKRMAFYIHSGLPDDLGIQYQSYQEDEIVVENDHLMALPGLGHTGSEPFDEVNGWYRAFRGLAGSIRYAARPKGWNIWEHNLFPAPLRRAVRAMLLINAQASNYVLEHKLNNLTIESENNSPLNRRPPLTESNYYHYPTSNYMPLDLFDVEDTTDLPPGVRLMSMPLYVIYYVMEFMHWDWFEELYSNDERRGYRLTSSQNEDENDYEYEGFSGGNSRHNPRQSNSRGRGSRQATGSQQNLARLLTHMFMQHQGDEDDDDDDAPMVIDAHTLHVMNTMFGGGFGILQNMLVEGNESDDTAEENFDEMSDEEEQEEESKEDVYISVNNDGSESTWTPLVSDNVEYNANDGNNNNNNNNNNNSYGGDYDDDDYDDEDDEEYSQLSSRY